MRKLTRKRWLSSRSQTRTENSSRWRAARTRMASSKRMMTRLKNGSNNRRTGKRTLIELNKITRRISSLMLLRLLPQGSHPQPARTALQAQPNKKEKNCKPSISIKLHQCLIRTRPLAPQEEPPGKWLSNQLSSHLSLHLQGLKPRVSPSSHPTLPQQKAQSKRVSLSATGSSNGRTH